MCLPNLLAGGLPAGALPGLALAADNRAHARHTKRDVWVLCTGEDMKEAIEMGPHLYCCCDISRAYPYMSFCTAYVCCALLCGLRVLCSVVNCKRQAGQRTCRQAPSQESRQAKR